MTIRPHPDVPLPASPVSGGLTFRLLHAWEEFLAAEELQRAVWEMPDWRDVVPANLLVTIAKNGGCVLGAFDGNRLVGFAFSFVGIDSHLPSPVIKHSSHMLAVLPEYQSRKIGVQLKLQQREFALRQKINLMTWTYDPLLALNANLNIVRLGVIARRYVANAYGEMTDGLNAGLPSDRFEVEWWLDSPRARERIGGKAPRADWNALSAQGARPVFQVLRDENRIPRIESENDLGAEVLLVEIPIDLPAVKAANVELAQAWRAHTRSVFERAFAAGYAVTDFILAPTDVRAAYVLTPGRHLENS